MSSYSRPNQRSWDRSPGRGAGGGRVLGNYSRADPEPKKITEMPYERLLELKSMESEEVLLTLQDANCGFVELMNMAAIGSEVLIPIVGVIASACRSTLHRPNLVKLITDACNSKLASKHLPKYLNKVQDMDSKSKMAFLKDMTVPLKTFLKGALSIVPTLAAEKLELCVTIFQTCLGMVLQQLPESISSEYQDMLKEMEDMRKTVLQPYIELENENKRKVFGGFPQSFREMAIAPSAAELHGDADPFLQQNIVAGRYRNGEHYLDVQFRLLREDFVGPLRAAIKKYREIVGAAAKDDAAVAKALKEVNEMNIYRLIQVKSQDFSGSGMEYVLWLDTAVDIDWENSRRLITDSLLCISNDNFENIAIAIVIERDLERDFEHDVAVLRLGSLSVQIIEGRATVDVRDARGFVVVENPAYFGAFSPILKGLQAFEGDNLPFSKYIVDVNTNMAPPKYAQWDTRFDFSPLLPGFKSEDDRIRDISQGSVPILDTDKWPDKEQFGLDESQYSALQGALTRELAIIQGPPGTGKTFLGLKILKALIYNKDAWQDRRAPILTVCLTNHALDQFLEGILEQVGTKDIVRVGGQSSSEKLKFYNLREWRRRIANQSRRNPSSDLKWNLKALGHQMLQHKDLVNTFWKKVIYEIELGKIITSEHRQQMDYFKKRARAGCGMLVWLGGAITQADLNKVDQNIAEEGDDFHDNQPILNTDTLKDLFGRITFMQLSKPYVGFMKAEEMCNGGRQVAAVQSAFSKIFTTKMMSKDTMTEQEVGCVQNLDDLTPRNRWRLYRYWVFKLRDVYQADLDRLQHNYEQTSIRMKQMEIKENTDIIGDAIVVGMTTTGAAKNQTLLQAINPQIVIVEEAAEVLEAHIITSLTKDCDHLILIGDHQQLRPKTNMHNLARRYNLDVSLFERMINNGMPFESLKLQHRMRPEISRLLVPNIYKELFNHASVEGRPQIRGVAHSVYFVNHGMQESDVSDSASKENLFEADYAAALCRHLILQGYDGDKITVLTPYVEQVNQLKKRMFRPISKGVIITTVDNYQGEENDIIILSLVRSNAENKIGFLKIENRVCVALSRARNGLFVIGNFDFMMENGGDVWNPIVSHLRRVELIGPALRLVCENHTNDVVEAKSAEDFKKSPEGGCTRPCEAVMVCGHLCTLSCHYYDKEHVKEKARCHKPCKKILCERGHGCKRKCFEDCFECNVPVDVVMPVCGHVIKLRCSSDPKKAECLEKCNRDRPCGHKCLDRCHEKCSDSCNTLVDVNRPCGHIVHLPCCKKDDMKMVKESCNELYTITLDCGHINQLSCCKKDDVKLAKQSCMEQCETSLDCGHKCTGTCGRCHQGRFHIICTKMCERKLVCGHLCRAPCAAACPPCTMQCENKCIHSKCPYKCGMPCKPCLQKCPCQCAHHKCTQPCWKECDRPPCQESCHQKLPCRHQCIGMCGEPCPKKCRVCNRDEICRIFFGAEDDEDARFVELEDCGHVFEVNALDHWMKGDKGDGKHEEVVMKGCPKCKTVVRRSFRYGSQVKKTIKDVVNIKELVLVQMKKSHSLAKEIFNKCYKAYEIVHVERIVAEIEESLENSTIHSAEYFLLDTLAKIVNKVGEIHRDAFKHLDYTSRQTIVDYLGEIARWLLDMVQLKYGQCGSKQQLEDTARQLTRVSLLLELLEIPNNGHLLDNALTMYNDAMLLVASLKPFTQDAENTVVTYINEIREVQGSLWISIEENIDVVRALDVICGHWLKCPYGHYYVFTEFSEKEKCKECHGQLPLDGTLQ